MVSAPVTPDRPAPAAHLAAWRERLALAVPVLVVAAVASLGRPLDPVANARLEAAGRQVAWGSADFGAFLEQLYPPIPVAAAALVPGGPVWLAGVGAVVAGVAVHALVEQLRRREVPGWLTVVLISCFVANPAFMQLATEDLADFIGAALFVVALVGFLRFAADGDTHGGFVCGLALGLGAACSPVMALYALFLGLAAAPVGAQRYRDRPHAARASALVVTFPALGALAGWAFLEWRFTGSGAGWLRAAAPGVGVPDQKVATLLSSLRTVGLGAASSPLFVLTQVVLARRRRPNLLVTALAVVALASGLWLGLRKPSGYSAVLLSAVALASVPSRPSPTMGRWVAGAAVAGWIVLWTWAVLSDDRLGRWATALVT